MVRLGSSLCCCVRSEGVTWSLSCLWLWSVFFVYYSVCIFFFFFFQAEDGIRDHCVTGVQTCALPILVYGSRFLGGAPHRVLYFWHSVGNWLLTLLSNCLTNINLSDMETCYKVFKSEERRVGKECRFWWWANH